MWISYLNETLAPNFESDTKLPILSIDVSLSYILYYLKSSL